MDQKIAVLFMPDNIACTEEKTPLMLQPILFCPVLTWMCAELCGRGIERLFIVSDVSAQEQMKPYLPKDADVTFVDGAKHAEVFVPLPMTEFLISTKSPTLTWSPMVELGRT